MHAWLQTVSWSDLPCFDEDDGSRLYAIAVFERDFSLVSDTCKNRPGVDTIEQALCMAMVSDVNFN